MSKEVSSVRSISKPARLENNENEFELQFSSTPLPPSRKPLNSIPDPSQCEELDPTLVEKQDVVPPLRSSNFQSVFGTRKGKALPETSSVQSTPGSPATARRVSIIHAPGGKGGNFTSRVTRGIPLLSLESSVEVPHFELAEDPSFWRDHSVQVLIRIRPPSDVEKATQGYGRCLRQESEQTLVWLGHPETRFTFDHVACESLSQEKLFRVAGNPMVENCMSGYNSCMFAYGQTGSGKTYTMMGEIGQMSGNLNDHRGITPRIFEYLFARIREEEEKQKSERLKFSCKCSFLEIYNEQITDLLEPSSPNLHLREDSKKGVYVENLTEVSVTCVDDVLRFLLQGASNRKMAATHMNSESSRSHSVFTCNIESCWEKDSMKHFRFGKLNLVDLAGSERQKSSGADGERLREAANINKSLSTLGLVIMSLVDLAQGKQRHVPYRDSRLTFLLQDSLGGNSKTTIIANISPSSCSANETLSTLKFAQRAKLIQNNAKVNEDASGDILILQQQIQQLKGQLFFLMKHHDSSKQFSNSTPSLDQSSSGILPERFDLSNASKIYNDDDDERTCGRHHKVHQLEEDAQRNKIMFKFRDEKNKRFELLEDKLISVDKYLINENAALREEIQVLASRLATNPELTRLELENNKLLRQLRVFQNFYDHGLREKMVAEISELRQQIGSMSHRSELLKNTPHSLAVHEGYFLEKSNHQMKNTSILEYNDMKKQLMEARLLVEELELEQVHLVEEMKILREENFRLLEMLDRNDSNEILGKITGSISEIREPQVRADDTDLIFVSKGHADTCSVGLQGKLEKVSKDLEVALFVNHNCMEEEALTMSMKQQTDSVCMGVEMESSKTILLLQEEIFQIKTEFQEKVCSMAEEIISLKETLGSKEEEMMMMCAEWERATLDLTNFLTDGSRSLQDATSHIESIAGSFPNADICIGEHVERAAKTYIEKEETILLLKKSLEEAQQTVFQLDEKLLSLRSATIALTEAQPPVNAFTEDGIQIATGVSNSFLANNLTHGEMQINEAEKMNCSSDILNLSNIIDKNGQPLTSRWNFCKGEFNRETELAKREVLELKNAIKISFCDAEKQLIAIKSDGYSSLLFFKDSIQDIINDIKEMQTHFTRAKEKPGKSQMAQMETDEMQSTTSSEISGCGSVYQMLHKILYELVGARDSLKHIICCFCKILNPYGYQGAAEESIHLGGCTKFSASSCYFSDETNGSSHPSDFHGSATSQNIVRNLSQEKTLSLLRKEFGKTYYVFTNLRAHFDNIFSQKVQNCLCSTPCFCNSQEVPKSNHQYAVENEFEVRMSELVPGHEVVIKPVAETSCNFVREGIQLDPIERTKQANIFFHKFEEAHRTIKEADHTLQALTKSNESGKLMTCIWEQAVKDLQVEKARLAEEINQMNSDICGRGEYEILQNQMHLDFTEITSSISSIEDTFRETQKYVDALCKSVLSDASEMVKETTSCICDSKLLLDDIVTTVMGNGVASLVLRQCHTGDLIHKLKILNRNLVAMQGECYQECDNGRLDIDGQEVDNAPSLKEKDFVHANPVYDNADLWRELERKEALLKGLLFDFSLLQELASSKRDVKDEVDKLIAALSEVESELRIQKNLLDELIVQNRLLENQLKDAQGALFVSRSDLAESGRKLEIVTKENAGLRGLVNDLYLKKSEIEEELREHKQGWETLEKEIIFLTSSADNQVTREKIQLLEHIRSLQDKLDIAYALANENEAIAVESHQESEASKIYAEQKEEEVKILEHSVEELEGTINILEKKVHEMEEEVESHHMIRDSLELELQALKERLLTVENFTESLDFNRSVLQRTEEQFQRSLSHHKDYEQIRVLEVEKAELVKEVKQCKEYISEILLHAEAQSLQYQNKYKDLESMICGFESNSNLENQEYTSDIREKVSTRARGSSSPFRCISSLVHHMNLEKDQELSVSKLRIEELEAMVAQRQQEVCIVKKRLAAAENMTHDVIRDLLGVKLDMTSYADLIDQHQLQGFIVNAHQKSQEYSAMEKEVLNLRRKMNDLIMEREAFIEQVRRREAIELAAQMSIEQLKERDQMLTAQNELLKVEKFKLQSKVVELEEKAKGLYETPGNMQLAFQRQTATAFVDHGKRLPSSKPLVLGKRSE
ncbi:unnamed protein product [Cuscuta campestris]|uniref:Kinesin motor domain-containing protein n=1 Tax=Cuscuta campestris TaxID=132261 RepID=A0A484LEM9_9ASTE|nr:unnamed protein product [Cuscuta campestris]